MATTACLAKEDIGKTSPNSSSQQNKVGTFHVPALFKARKIPVFKLVISLLLAIVLFVVCIPSACASNSAGDSVTSSEDEQDSELKNGADGDLNAQFQIALIDDQDTRTDIKKFNQGAGNSLYANIKGAVSFGTFHLRKLSSLSGILVSYKSDHDPIHILSGEKVIVQIVSDIASNSEEPAIQIDRGGQLVLLGNGGILNFGEGTTIVNNGELYLLGCTVTNMGDFPAIVNHGLCYVIPSSKSSVPVISSLSEVSPLIINGYGYDEERSASDSHAVPILNIFGGDISCKTTCIDNGSDGIVNIYGGSFQNRVRTDSLFKNAGVIFGQNGVFQSKCKELVQDTSKYADMLKNHAAILRNFTFNDEKVSEHIQIKESKNEPFSNVFGFNLVRELSYYANAQYTENVIPELRQSMHYGLSRYSWPHLFQRFAAFSKASKLNQDLMILTAKSGNYVKLDRDIERLSLDPNQSLIVDLNGHKILNTEGSSDAIYVPEGSSLVLEGSGSVVNSSTGSALFNEGTVVIKDNVKIKSNSEESTILNHGDLSLLGNISVENENQTSALIECGYSEYESHDNRKGYVTGLSQPTAYIYAGEYIGGNINIKCNESGHIFIYGGTFSGAASNTIRCLNEVNIYGGKYYFMSEKSAQLCTGSSTEYRRNDMQGKLTIYGGEFIQTASQDSKLAHWNSLISIPANTDADPYLSGVYQYGNVKVYGGIFSGHQFRFKGDTYSTIQWNNGFVIDCVKTIASPKSKLYISPLADIVFSK